MSTNNGVPDVYFEEVNSSIRPIMGVATNITAFIGRALRGPLNEAKTIYSFEEYIEIFGGLMKESNMSYAVYHYFLNGGMTAVIVRVFKEKSYGNDGVAKFEMVDTALKLKASNPGLWGENLDITIVLDSNQNTTKEDSTLFNLVVVDSKSQICENYDGVSTNSNSSRFIRKILEEQSRFIRVDGEVPFGKPSEGKFVLNANSANDGDSLDADGSLIKGNSDNKTGIFALDKIDLFNLLCIPPYTDESQIKVNDLYTVVLDYCESRRAIFIVDPPQNWNDKSIPLKKHPGSGGIDDPFFKPDRNANAAIYFPRILAADPLENGLIREFVPCGAVCGIIARMDTERGIWKAPAGMDAKVMGAANLSIVLTDNEKNQLNKAGINCLRILPPTGIVVWGSRTLQGSDEFVGEWKYIPVRRTALFIEESLYRGTKWVLFEPNDESLWTKIRNNVGVFLNDLFLKGAFQGRTATEACFVKCDSETTTQADIDRGVVNIIVGFAPLKPAEFVIIKIQQMAGRKDK